MRAVSGGRRRLGLSSSGGHDVGVLKRVMEANEPAGSGLGHLQKSVTRLETQLNVQICLRRRQSASLFSALYVWSAGHNVCDMHMLAEKLGSKAESGATYFAGLTAVSACCYINAVAAC